MELNKELKNPIFKRKKKPIKLFFALFCVVFLFLASCSISYKFNGASIDYTKIKTISIADFPNVSELVYPPLSQQFSEELRDIYTKQTQLRLVRQNGDLNLEGEIVGYQLTPMSISADTYASETKLTVTVKVRFTNKVNPVDDFEKTYSAFQVFDSSKMLNDVQEELVKEIIKEITENIYNDTVAKW
ncbi:MAG TPA: LptE family protein [Paludibacteraceae bacterium]|jgi:hypothetical protein|nr:LptE family protein [Paludibacteraceae bacterium]MDS1031278.1 LptE family protein [Porphyromonadaceae sp. NP-X]NLJ20714.1 LptE family protein [Bacteroidales bacterium]OPZ02609.1 MAG: hypothetical protein BWZ11_00776 [Bacteroidetes bacterium ADurb.BinA395]MBP9017626.1 LptE family protein [Paludibacteraceae bacterium]